MFLFTLSGNYLSLNLNNHPILSPIVKSLGIIGTEQNAAVGHRGSEITCPEQVKAIAIGETMETIHEI